MNETVKGTAGASPTIDTPGVGHNSGANDQLKSFVERIERLEEEKSGIATDIRDVYGEAKGKGFDVKIMRAVVRLRKKDAAQRAEEDALLDLYLHALGMLELKEAGMD